MILLEIKLVLLPCLLLGDIAFRVIGFSNPTNLPVISTSSDSALNFIGENSILFPRFTEITLTCTANYLIRWDSTIPAASYDLPTKYREGPENDENGLPKRFKYETSIHLMITSSTVGFALCLKFGDSTNSSELMVYGSESAYQSLREGLIFNAVEREELDCETAEYKEGDTDWAPVSENPEFTLYPEFGLVVYTTFDLIGQYDFCEAGRAVEFSISESQGYTYEEDVPSLTHLLLEHKRPHCSAVGQCFYWSCSNPLHCIIAMRTTAPSWKCPAESTSCTFLSNCCHHPTSYLYEHARIDETNFLATYEHETFMNISGPPEEEMVVNETVTYTCAVVSFYFGQQIVFGIRFRNNSVEWLDEFSELEEIDTLRDGDLFLKRKNLTLEPSMKEVICIAPRFDSEYWFNISINISVMLSDNEMSTSAIQETSTTPESDSEEIHNVFASTPTQPQTLAPTTFSYYETEIDEGSIESESSTIRNILDVETFTPRTRHTTTQVLPSNPSSDNETEIDDATIKPQALPSNRSSDNDTCHSLRLCDTCLTLNCTWVGQEFRYPCRTGPSDIDPEEKIVLPLPQKGGDCTRDPSAIIFPPPKNTEAEVILLILFVVSLALMAFGIAIQCLIKKRGRQSSTEEENQELEFTEFLRSGGSE